MKTPAGIVLALVIAGLAGCAGTPDAQPDQAAASSVEAETQPDVAAGSITGIVVDDEARPIKAASVHVVQLDLSAITGDDGAFEFLNVPVGEYSLLVDRLGYESSGVRIQVDPDQQAVVEIQINAIVITVPWYSSVVHVAQHHIGETYVTWANAYAADEYDLVCSGCEWVDTPAPEPMHLVFEVFGQHAVTNPLGDAEHWWVWDTGVVNGTRIQENIDDPLPSWTTIPAEDRYEQTKDFFFELMCETAWVCIEERREAYVTFFYDTDEVPETFTAGPQE